MNKTVNISVESYEPIKMIMVASALTLKVNASHTRIRGNIKVTVINEGHFLLFTCFFLSTEIKKKN